MSRVFVWAALWNIDTWVNHRSGGNDRSEVRDLSAVDRYQLLARVVQQARQRMVNDLFDHHFDDVLDSRTRSWLFLFVAPEYYFAFSDVAHAISQAAKDDLVARLRVLSTNYPSLILIPGTIAWKKPVVRRGMERYRRDPTTGLRTTTAKTSSRLTKFEQRVKYESLASVALAEHTADREIAELLRNTNLTSSQRTEYSSTAYRTETIQIHLRRAVRNRQVALEGMQKRMDEDPDRCFVARNTLYAFYEGREVARYHKRGNFNEVVASESDRGFVIFEPGGGPEAAGDRFDIEGVSFAVEVCVDHTTGYLSQLSRHQPDVQIIVSAAVQLVPQHVHARRGCFVVHASSDRDATAFYQNRGDGVQALATADEPAERGLLRYHLMILDS